MMPNEKNTKRVILALDQAYEKFIQLEDKSTDEAEIVSYRCLYTNIYESKLYVEQMQEEINRLNKRFNRKSRWIVNTKKYGEDNYHCLLCGAIVEKDEAGRHYWQRCYHCGAYMELMDGTDRDYDKDGEQKC